MIFLSILISVMIVNKNKTCYNGKTNVIFTNYWIPKEGEKDLDDYNHVIYLNGDKNKKILDINNNIISMVSDTTYNKFKEEGTGILDNGVMVNLGTKNNRFEIVNTKKYPFGIGANDNILHPFTSVAVNDIPLNTLLYIRELDGFILPNNKTHNGCIKVDDTGYGFDKCHIDFFVLKYTNYIYLQKELNKDKITVTYKNCYILNYTTNDMLEWI